MGGIKARECANLACVSASGACDYSVAVQCYNEFCRFALDLIGPHLLQIVSQLGVSLAEYLFLDLIAPKQVLIITQT